jgi:predicted dehydrogenase
MEMTTKVGLLGTTGHTGLVLGGIPGIEDCELVAVCPAVPGEDISGLRKNKAWTESTRIYETPLEVLDKAKPDVVGVCMRIPKNAEASCMALERGVSVVSEKPLATEMEDLYRLQETAKHSSGRITAMLSFRFFPDYVAAHRAVTEQKIGPVCLAFGQKSYRWGERNNSYRTRDTYGGTIPWVAIHAIDFLRWASGREFVSVQGMQANLVRTDFPGCEDCGGLLFQMDNGGQAVLTFDYLRPACAPTHGDDRMRLVGSKGIVEVRTAEGFAEIVTDEEDSTPLELERSPHFFVDFLRELREGTPHRVSQEDAFRVTEIALEARRACDEGRVVSLRQEL